MYLVVLFPLSILSKYLQVIESATWCDVSYLRAVVEMNEKENNNEHQQNIK